MLKKLQLLFIVALASFNVAKAQVGQGALKGKVLDKTTNEPVPFANVILELNGKQIAGTTTDFDGVFFIKPVPPGKYDVKATYVGYQPAGFSGVIIKSDQTTYQDIKMNQGVELSAFEFIDYEVPLINKNGESGGTVTREEIAKMPGRSAESVALTVGGIYSQDGERGSVRGSREDATETYIDGVKVRGSANIPQSAIEQVSVLMGGVPAQYGDATGGIISITTRGAASEYFGGLEVVSSQLTDKFGYNLLGFSVSGPLLSRIDPVDSLKKPFLGFFLSGELRHEKDARPSATGAYKIKDDVLTELQENPLRPSGTGSGTFQNAEYLRADDFEKVSVRQNASRQGVTLQGKIDVNTSKNTNLTFGGTYDYTDRRLYNFDNALFNSYNNALATENTWRVYSRFTQRFGNESSNSSESSSNIKNAYYSIQMDYSKEMNKYEDATHKDNLFNYGYIGKFTSTYKNNYTYQENVVVGGVEYSGDFHDNFEQLSYDFEPGTLNPSLSNYTSSYFDLNSGLDKSEYAKNQNMLQLGGALLNGMLPMQTYNGGIYNIWNVPGLPYNDYQIRDNSMFRIRTTGSADIKNHAILVGFEYEQRDDRGFQVGSISSSAGPYNLWELGRQLTNSHISQLDTSSGYVITWDGSFPTITYQRKNESPGSYVGGDAQSFFDYNVRKELGFNEDGVDFIDFDSYDPSTYKLSYFSATELLQQNFVTYYGYDHAGSKLKGNVSFDDYFTAKDEYGNLTRAIGAFRPIYLAGYIQDKFDFEDLKFNVGVRVDRFDANQKVLKDPYVFFETMKVSEVGGAHPSNIGDDYVMYVSDINDPKLEKIVGYRNGNVWYNAEGVEISDPKILQSDIGIAPWLRSPGPKKASDDLESTGFQDYKPQLNIMPRIAFSFPISDEALFFAHYDILTQRPLDGARLDIADYMFINSRSNRIMNNPNLMPEKTIDYELGFQQALNKSSSIKLSAFYRELRDMVQLTNITYAYPQHSYITYGNIDFGTVKGFTTAYDLRKTGNVSLRATYTLQFAEGTGSSASSGFNLVSAGQPNLRTAVPLDYDQRHSFTVSLDYRYDEGKNYNGPVWFNKQILANTGMNVQAMGGSGTPYSAQYNIIPEGFVTSSNNQLKGGVNGARKPFTFRTDIRIDRDIILKTSNKDGKAKETSLNIYLLLRNALNNKNVLRVYQATGTSDDDGYLNAPEYQNGIAVKTSEAAFRDLYTLKLSNPTYFSMPRMIRIGAIMNF